MSGFIEALLRPFDHEGNELIVRFRLWKHRWFPYRTAHLLGVDDKGELLLGPWVWHPPGVWRNRWPK